MTRLTAKVAIPLVAIVTIVLGGVAPLPAGAGGTGGASRYRSFDDPSLCLDANGAEVYLLECNGGAYQLWFYTAPSGRLQLIHSVTSLCLADGYFWDATVNTWVNKLYLRSCHLATGDDDATWLAVGVNGHIYFRNAATNRCPVTWWFKPVLTEACPLPTNVPNKFAWDYYLY